MTTQREHSRHPIDGNKGSLPCVKYIIAVIITIIIVVVLTALEMKWIAFFISLFTAFFVTRYIYIRVKFGKVALKEFFFEHKRELPGNKDR